MNNIAKGRAGLITWEHSKPDNMYRYDTNLQNVIRRYLGSDGLAEIEPGLLKLGEFAAGEMDRLAKEEDQIGKHPHLERWNEFGEQLEDIQYHPNHDVIGRQLWKSEVLSIQARPGNVIHQNALFYLMSTNGEGGHLCSITCTAGLIRALQQVGSRDLKDRYLPRLLDSNFETMIHAAQFLTEVQGGSDVGANAVLAQPAEDGSWRISGEKWFCSNINSDLFLMTARPIEAPGGTRGLGMFLVPRRLEDGSLNGFTLRRLKDKLGTRTLASAEADFNGAVAYPIGPLEDGFKNTVELVLNTSRLMNAVACAAFMTRAGMEAWTFACSREAFGQPIANYPMIQESVADIHAEAAAATASSFALAALVDRIDTGLATDDEAALFRLLVNVNKYITSIRGSEAIHQAIEVLGGNGAIESFSILPRLYRDMIVLESWEGAHNVLALQVLRDISKYGIHDPFIAWVETLLNGVADTDLVDLAALTRSSLERINRLLNRMNINEGLAQAHARRLIEGIGACSQAALLLAETSWELHEGLRTNKADLTRHFINRRLNPAYDHLNDEQYLPRLTRIMGTI